LSFAFEDEVGRSVEYLASDLAQDSIRQDPYWPKWDSPWWHMTLLWEMGLAELIPRNAVEVMVDAFRSWYLTFFPLRFDLLPPEVDTRRQALCHCAAGTMYQVLSACEVEVDVEVPWMRPWFFRYQLPDGGLNCDEEAYTKPTPKSSIVSTLPPLEAVLFSTGRDFTFEEVEFLDRGAEYLIDHRLYRSVSSGEVTVPDWLDLCFPRFYMYDVLRGLRFLARWAVVRRKSLPETLVAEASEAIRKSLTADGLVPARRPWIGETTLMLGEDGEWSKGPESSFPLLEAVSRTDAVSPTLTQLWEAVEADLGQL
jgi:hypothetical protein